MNDLFALDTKEEALCRSPFPAWPSLAKRGGNWVVSETFGFSLKPCLQSR